MPPPCCAIQLRHPPFRSGTCFPPRLGAQSEQLKHPPQYGHANVSARRSTVSCGYLRGHQSQSNFFCGDRCNGRTVSRCDHRSILCGTARLPTHRSLYSAFGPARVAPAMVAIRQQSRRRRRRPPAFLGTIKEKRRRRGYCARTRIGFVAFVIIVAIFDPIYSLSFVRKLLGPPLPLDCRT